jgi:hypothetical protein
MNVKQGNIHITTLDEVQPSSNASSDDSSDHDTKVTRTQYIYMKRPKWSVIDLCSSSAEEDGVNTTKVTEFVSISNKPEQEGIHVTRAKNKWSGMRFFRL